MKRRWLCLASLLVLAALAAPPAAAYRPAGLDKIEPALLGRFAAAGSADLIVRFAEQADLSPAFRMSWRERGRFVYEALRETAARSQAGAIDIVKGHGLDYQTFIAGNELYVRGGSLGLALELAALPAVAALRAPRTAYLDPLLLEAAPESPEALTWGVIDVKADQFWSAFGRQGEGIVVASIDSGVHYLHPALDQAYKCAANPSDPACWYDPSGSCSTPCDTTPHGTPTLGPILADDDPSLTYQAGVAPGAQWIACRGCSQYACDEASLNACADWVLAPGGSPDNRPHVVYNGWGGQGGNSWFQGKVQAWLAAGILAAFSPGAQGPSCATLGSPGDYQEVLTGTAHDSNRNIASFASRGPSPYGHEPYTKPNISAPGVSMCVPVPPDGWSCGYSGTSFSAAYPVGAVALLWSCAPDLVGQVYATFEALQGTANVPPDGTCGAPPDGEGNYTYGYGYLDVLAAGQAYCGPSQGALEGHVYDAGTGAPLGGAVVTALPGPVQDITDPQGHYALDLFPGTYTVTAAADGYFSDSVTLEIASGVTTTQDFSLTLQPYPPTASFETSSPVCLGRLMSFTDTSQAVPPVTAWWWTFGDGGTSDAPDPVYTYTAAGSFTVTLAVTNAVGWDDATGTVVVHPLPEASFSYAPVGGPAPLTVRFTDTSQYAANPRWDLGDAFTATGAVVTHTYLLPGTYTVTLEVDSAFGCGGAEAAGVVAVGEAPPVAAFSFSPLSNCAPAVVQFYDESMGNPTAWWWTFGDGGTSAAPDVVYTYTAAGSFTVTLVVTNAGGWDDVTGTVVVHPLPEASFSYAPAGGPAPLTVRFTDTSQYAANPRWDLGDAFTATGAVVTHTYLLPGIYTVTLEVDSEYGCAPGAATGRVVVNELHRHRVYLPILFRGYRP